MGCNDFKGGAELWQSFIRGDSLHEKVHGCLQKSGPKRDFQGANRINSNMGSNGIGSVDRYT